ncbi:MAG: hypothetical protein ACRD1E_12160, partial [Terriglobales bacterium]
AALGHLYALTGKRKLAQEVLQKLHGFAASRYVSPFEFASVHFALNQPDAGFEWLRKAVRDRSFELLFINVDPRFDAARSDKRFAGVAGQLGLGGQGAGTSGQGTRRL